MKMMIAYHAWEGSFLYLLSVSLPRKDSSVLGSEKGLMCAQTYDVCPFFQGILKSATCDQTRNVCRIISYRSPYGVDVFSKLLYRMRKGENASAEHDELGRLSFRG